MQITDCSKEYLKEICALEKQCFKEYWNENMLTEEAESPFNIIKTAVESDGSVSGYIIIKRVFEEAEILRICVLEKERRRGIAEKLLKSAIDESITHGVNRFFLEVRISNAAASALYKKCGFQLLDIRKRYYRDGEDAAVYYFDADDGK